MSVYDWDGEDEFEDEPEDEFPDEFEDVYFSPFSGVFTVVERIREYVQEDYSRYTPDVVREVEAVQRYIESGITQFERLLENHAAFDVWLAERGESVV